MNMPDPVTTVQLARELGLVDRLWGLFGRSPSSPQEIVDKYGRKKFDFVLLHSPDGKYYHDSRLVKSLAQSGLPTQLDKVQARLAGYKALLQSMPKVVEHLNNEARDIQQGDLKRVVLDVYEGGVFYSQLDNNFGFVYAVTLRQEEMESLAANKAFLALEGDLNALFRKQRPPTGPVLRT